MPTLPTLPTVISYDDWMETTKASIFHRRSSQLQELDSALQEYNANKTEENLDYLRVKFQLWANSKEDFTQSIRNTGSEAPWKLYIKLFFTRHTDAQTERELALMRDSQRDLCYQMFRGCEMVLKSKRETAQNLAGDVKSLLEQLGFTDFSIPSVIQNIIDTVRSGVTAVVTYVEGKVSSIDGIVKMVANFIIGLVKTMGIAIMEFIDMLAGELRRLIENLLFHLIPFASTIKFAVEFGPQVYALVRKQITITQSIRARNFLVEGDPKAALDSLCSTLRDERNDMAIDMTTGVIASVTDIFAPAGAQAVKWADDFRKTLTSIIRTIDTLRQMRKANQIFRSIYVSSFGLEIFKVSPLIACYLIVSCSQSQLVAMLPGNASNFSTWILYAKSVIDLHIRPLQDEARRIINEHICEIKGIGDALRTDAENLRKAIIRHKELTQGYLGDIHKVVHLSKIQRFDISSLKRVSTRKTDPLQAMREFEISLRQIDNKILGQSLINNHSFMHETPTLSTQIITDIEWRKMTWVTFGRRHEFTQSIDEGLINYQSLCNTRMKKYTGSRPIIKKEQLSGCLSDLQARVDHLTRQIGVPLHQWLDPTNPTHQASKRLPAMRRLKVLLETETSLLSQLHSEYSSKLGEATELFDNQDTRIA